jgi:hypothetical protein
MEIGVMTSHGQKTGLKSHRQKEKIRRKRERERGISIHALHTLIFR